MDKLIILMLCIALAVISVACNLSASTAGASIELRQSTDQQIPTATTEPTIGVTPQAPTTDNNGSNTGQLPPTAILPAVTFDSTSGATFYRVVCSTSRK